MPTVCPMFMVVLLIVTLAVVPVMAVFAPSTKVVMVKPFLIVNIDYFSSFTP